MNRQMVGTDGGVMGWMPASVTRRPGWVLAAGALILVCAVGTLTARRDPHALTLALDVPEWTAALLVAGAAALAWHRRRAMRRSPAPVAVPEPIAAPAEAAPAAEAAPVTPSIAAVEPEPAGPLRRILVKSGRSTVVLNAEEVSRIEADGRYVRLHAGDRTHLARYTLADLEARLDPAEFVRVHRSTVVRVDRIRRLRTEDYRDYDVVLDDGSTVRMSRTYRARVQAVLGARSAADVG
jgi:DNA-binding LytR/AlgR family response regulator